MKYIIKMTCKRCGKEFIAHSPARKFCSVDCQKANYKESGKAKEQWTKANHKKQQKNYSTYSNGKTRCLICGAWVKAPAMHAWQKHRISARDYKKTFSLPYGKGLLPEDLKEVKKDYVFDNGTVKNLKKGVHTRYKKGDARRLEGVKRRLELGQIKKLRI